MRAAPTLLLPLLVALPAHAEPAAPALLTSERHQDDAFRQPDRLVAALGLHPGMRVADVGAGAGYLTLRLARAVGASGRVVATDVDPRPLAVLRARAAEAGLGNIETRVVPADDPGLDEAAFDRVLLAQVDHLLPDRAAWLARALRTLRPGGRIVVANRDRYRAALKTAVAGLPATVAEPDLGLAAQFVVTLTARRGAR